MIRVLALTNDTLGSMGGIAQYLRDFMTALAGDGRFEITMLPRVGRAVAGAVPGVRELAPMKNRTQFALRAMVQALRGFDLVYCGHPHLAQISAAVAKLARAKLVVQGYGVDVWTCPRPLIRNAFDRADLVLSISRDTRARVLEWARTDPARAVVVACTVDADFTPGEGQSLRTEWGLDGKFILLSVGRMSADERHKGHERVIAALPALLRDFPHLVYLVLGDGSDLERIRSVAAAAGVADQVIFKGAVDRERLVEAYRMSDLFVMPSTQEGFGIAFLEAMACGTRALGLAVGGAVDPLCDGELGISAHVEEFETILRQAISGAKPDRSQLFSAVQARFGRPIFARHVCNALLRCAGAA